MLILLISINCGTIVNGGRQAIRFVPAQPGTKIDLGTEEYKIEEEYLDLNLKRQYSYSIKISAPGEKKQELMLERQISGWTYWNFWS